MAKTPPPLLGFNNNVRHHGRIFHIQTEDSGVKRPHIITHLFGDGGRILKSIRTDYSEHLESEDMAAVVRRMMKEQHKAMFVALRSGELDDVIVAAFGPHPTGETKARLPSAPPAPKYESTVASPEEFAASAAPMPTPMPEEWQRALAVARLEPESEPVAERPPSVPRLPTPLPTSRSIESAVEAVAAKAAGVVAPAGPPTPDSGTPLSAPPLQRRRPAPDSAGRYSVSRPASIFGDAPAPDSRSIFGDSLIGEKSLDEVILSYLAEDLEK